MSAFVRNRALFSASVLVSFFFFILLWFYATNLYHTRFFDTGGIVVAYQAMRILYIPYLLWLQYALGAGVLHIVSKRAIPLSGAPHFIAAFLAGTSAWHILLLFVGLAGLLFYPVMLLLVSVVMLLSIPHMARILSRVSFAPLKALSGAEKIMALIAALAAIAFILCKGTYPSGGHDFFNHYFTYYKEVIATGNLGPHETWYHYYYSKGLGLYFLSMILLDPFAVHLVGTSFVMVAACMVFDMLRSTQHKNLQLPFFGVFIYFAFYIFTPGRQIFAANGGWGDLEKTHELTAVLILGCIWLSKQAIEHRHVAYVVSLLLTAIALVIIGFAASTTAGVFFVCLLVFSLIRKEYYGVKLFFLAGLALGVSMAMNLLINYVNTGLPLDQLILPLWGVIDWQKVVKLGYTLELYSHLSDSISYDRYDLPSWVHILRLLHEYFRTYLLWPLILVGAVFMGVRVCKEGIRALKPSAS
jgi:hypothetical protein